MKMFHHIMIKFLFGCYYFEKPKTVCIFAMAWPILSLWDLLVGKENWIIYWAINCTARIKIPHRYNMKTHSGIHFLFKLHTFDKDCFKCLICIVHFLRVLLAIMNMYSTFFCNSGKTQEKNRDFSTGTPVGVSSNRNLQVTPEKMF